MNRNSDVISSMNKTRLMVVLDDFDFFTFCFDAELGVRDSYSSGWTLTFVGLLFFLGPW